MARMARCRVKDTASARPQTGAALNARLHKPVRIAEARGSVAAEGAERPHLMQSARPRPSSRKARCSCYTR